MMFGRGHTIVNRQAEWMMTLVMIGHAMTLIASPQSVELGGFFLLRRLDLSSETLCAIFMLGGSLRAVSLSANGHWPRYGPFVRALCAFCGTFLWAQMGFALFMWTHSKGYIGMGVSAYGVFALGEMVTIFRVVRDGRAN